MPIYEYRCERCGEVTDELQKFSDPPKTDCEPCGGDGVGTVTKLFSAHVVGAAAPSRSTALPPGCGRCDNPQGPCSRPN